jgi:2'-5' RNA ligase
MPRLRLGVALLLGPPIADEVDGLRRALGDGALSRIPPHLTLVPPVNVPESALGATLAVLRQAAARAPAAGLSLTLGPVRSFWPASPVLYLGVGGDLEALQALRDHVFVKPLSRLLTFPFVPHVTLADEASPAQLEAATTALSSYARVTAVDRVHLLREHAGRRWTAIADVAFGRPATVGRGGLELQLTVSESLDPEAMAALGAGGVIPPEPEGKALVITARRDGTVAGTGMAWIGPDGGRVEVFVPAGYRRQGIGGHVLAALESGVRSRGWECSSLISRCGPARFYRSRSAYSKAIEL